MKILCEEFQWLLSAKGSFWDSVRAANEKLEEFQKYERELLSKIVELVEAEEEAFADLHIDKSRTQPILSDVYGALRRAAGQDSTHSPSHADLGLLKKRLEQATSLVCKESQGKIRHARDWLVSWNGVRVLAGGAVVFADVAGPHVAVSWVSVKVGALVMINHLDGIIDLLPS
jgi:exonuclease VII large subunit